ncbi:FA complementation group M isoform X2 [Rhynchophorus ferrugineus]|uniref:FA complementation group M isoform X2 n=1 Tax=Rhynchophorus ferrugineus TaxID=354439 RepID=UPI003FCEB137
METNTIQTQFIEISRDIETDGFDLQAGKTWIYPTNYPTRDYQFNIIQKALHENTLVSLPTGLGKTFIAAVVMYNYFRWYPNGKIIFMAPTKPLVKQQIDACYNIMAIPPESTAELTGAKVSTSRANIWTEKRVFYVTPQVLQNDLNKIAELGGNLKCLVFDEAHRARGNHAYCEVIRRLVSQDHKYFRVLALSATPGNNVNDVLEVIQNLHISHLEFRTEESLDVQPYVYQRSLETIVVHLGDKLEKIRDEYLNVLEYYVKTLRKYNVIHGNCGSLTKGKIFMIMKDFQSKNRGTKSSNYSEIMRCLNICVTLYHAYELLIRHGLRNFLSFFDEHIEKPLLKGNTQIRSILNNVRDYLGPIPNVEVLPDGTYPEIPKNIVFGHPKYYKLRDILVAHFTNGEKNTRVIVFFEYRESVMEAHALLLQSRPLIQPKIFLGQGSGVTQKIQIGVVKSFREGKCNTLLSTCIGEEGLDVGEVDLIVCFDISSKSPIRMVQRMGRTGRKREGKVIALVTEGREQQTLKDCLIHKNNISTFVLGSKHLLAGMYNQSPRLIPEHIKPRCEKMFITVKKIEKKKSLKEMLRSISSNSSELIFSQDIDVVDVGERIPKQVMLFSQDVNEKESYNFRNIFGKHIEKQRTLQKTYFIGNSKNSQLLTNLLSFADAKRFNMPSQVQCWTQDNSKRNLRQGDIRNMFLKSTSQNDFVSTEEPSLRDIPTQLPTPITEEPFQESLNVPKEVFLLLSQYEFMDIESLWDKKCQHCPEGFSCKNYIVPFHSPQPLKNTNYVPSDDIIDTISLSDLTTYFKTLNGNESLKNDDVINFDDGLEAEIFEQFDFTQAEKNAIVFNDEKEEEAPECEEVNDSLNFQAPKSYSNLLDKFGQSIFETQKTQQPVKNNNTTQNLMSEQELLKWFKLDSLKDLFAESLSDVLKSDAISPVSQVTHYESDVEPDSPILLSNNKRHIRKKAINKSRSEAKECSNLNSTVDDIDELCDLSHFGISTDVKERSKSKMDDISEFCDLSDFGLVPEDTILESKSVCSKKIDLSEFCDLSEFGIDLDKKSVPEKKGDLSELCDLPEFGLLQEEEKPVPTNVISPCSSVDRTLDITDFYDLSEFGLNPDDNNIISSPKNNKSRENCYNSDDDFEFNLPTQLNNGKKLCTTQTIEASEVEKCDSGNKPICDDKTKDIDFLLSTQLTKSKPSPILKSQNGRISRLKQSKMRQALFSDNNDDELGDFHALTQLTNEKKVKSPKILDNKRSQISNKIALQKHVFSDDDDDDFNAITQAINKNNNVTKIVHAEKGKENNLDETGMSITQVLNFISESENETSIPNDKFNVSTKHDDILNNLANYEEFNDSFLSTCMEASTSKRQSGYTSSKRLNVKKTEENHSNSSDEFEDFKFLKPTAPKLANQKRKEEDIKNNKKPKSDFLELEAEVSDDDNVFISDDENEENLDCYDKSFVNDETQIFCTQMHAKYLQSTKSPVIQRKFKIPQRRFNVSNVFSQQPAADEHDTYLEDSFCVRTDEDEPTVSHEMSELEILEMKLKKKKKRKKSTEKPTQKSKRRRIVCLSSDDDSD